MFVLASAYIVIPLQRDHRGIIPFGGELTQHLPQSCAPSSVCDFGERLCELRVEVAAAAA